MSEMSIPRVGSQGPCKEPPNVGTALSTTVDRCLHCQLSLVQTPKTRADKPYPWPQQLPPDHSRRCPAEGPPAHSTPRPQHAPYFSRQSRWQWEDKEAKQNRRESFCNKAPCSAVRVWCILMVIARMSFETAQGFAGGGTCNHGEQRWGEACLGAQAPLGRDSWHWVSMALVRHKQNRDNPQQMEAEPRQRLSALTRRCLSSSSSCLQGWGSWDCPLP